MTDPAALVRAARALMRQRSVLLGGTWPRAVALLGRQALEHALDRFWARRAPGVEHASRAAQLLCLADYLNDDDLAKSAAWAWHALSRACHHHVYELPPTGGEIAALLDIVDRLVTCVEESVMQSRRPGV